MLSLNALLSSYIFPSEAALKEGECEGKIEFSENMFPHKFSGSI